MREVATTTAAAAGDGAPAEPSTGAAGHDGHTVLQRGLDDGLDLGGGVGEDDGVGQGAVDGAVVFVEEEVVGIGEDPGIADDAAEVGQQGGGGGGLRLGYGGHVIRHATACDRVRATRTAAPA